MPNFSSAIRAIVEAARKPSALPDIANRGTAADPVVLREAMKSPGRVAMRTPDLPFAGDKGIAPHVRTTEAPSASAVEIPSMGLVEDPVGTLKNMAKGFLVRDPEVTESIMRPSDTAETLYTGAWKKEIAPELADRDIAGWLAPIKRDPVKQASLLSDYMVTMDEWAQGQHAGKEKIRDIPIGVWKATADILEEKVKADPEVAAAAKNIRTQLDGMFTDMVNRGWIEPERHLKEYTPLMKLNASLEGLAKFTGENPQAMKDRLLSAQHSRAKSQGGIRETDIISILRSYRTEYLSKIAQHEAFIDILSDPTRNFTDKFHGQSDIPQDLEVYRVGEGGFGSTAKTREGYLLDAYGKALDPKGRIPMQGYVLPKRLVQALKEFDKRQLIGSEKGAARASANLAKWMTVYNPANTQLNRVSDLVTAMFFPHEGKAHPLGVLRFMGEGNAAGMKLAHGKGPHMVTLHGRTVDVSDLALQEGLTTSTIHHLVGGKRMPHSLAQFAEGGSAAAKKWESDLFSKMEADRLGVELAPRIAAGLEAVERTGDWSQFGKMGRDITFRYGAGAPRMSQIPILRAMAPFTQFQGLSTQRMLHTWGAKGMDGKARILAGVIAFQLSIHAWNTQNDAYKQAENSLPEYERNQLHAWMPGPDPGKPRLDIEGKPVAVRAKFLLPEAVASMFGLGNMAPRLARVAQGRDTPMQFVDQTVSGAAETIGGSLVIPHIIRQMTATDENKNKKPLGERIEKSIPLARTIGETVRATQNYGLGEGTIKFLQGMTGMRPATVMNRGTALMDAQFMAARAEVKQAVAAVFSLGGNGDPSKLKAALKRRDRAIAELERLSAQQEKEEKAGYNPPEAPEELPESSGIDDEILRQYEEEQQRQEAQAEEDGSL